MENSNIQRIKHLKNWYNYKLINSATTRTKITSAAFKTSKLNPNPTREQKWEGNEEILLNITKTDWSQKDNITNAKLQTKHRNNKNIQKQQWKSKSNNGSNSN